MQPHYSQSSRENATPSSGTSPLALLLGSNPPPPHTHTRTHTHTHTHTHTPGIKVYGTWNGTFKVDHMMT